MRRTLPNAGYVSPSPSFQDTLSSGMTFIRSVNIEPMVQTGCRSKRVIREFEQFF
jgi:hypothetical protein